MAYYSRDVAKKIAALKADSYYAGFTCKSEACPLFAQCAQMPATGRKYGKNAIRVFFVFESPSQDDVAAGVPAIGEAGQYFRNKWLDAFIKEAHGSDGVQSYMITHLVRTALIDAKNATRVPTAAELAYCGEHFWADLMEFKPNAIVAFGSTAYQQLYRKAKNKKELPDPEIGVGKLREKTIEMVFTDGYKARVFVGYAAGYILRSPASEPFFIEDCNRVINHFALKKKDLSRPKVEIDNIETRDTVEGALDFIDFLTRDLPRDQWHDLAFDIETNNLNRCYNNSFLTWQFSYKKGHAVVIPITHPEKPVFSDYKDQVKLIAAFKKLLNSSPEETRIAWLVGHNLKFDLSILYGLWKIVPRGSIPIWDTMLAMHWLNENRKGMGASLDGRPYSLKTLGKELFGFEYKSDAIAARADGDLVNLDFKDLVDYGGADTILTWNLKHHQMKLATEQPDNAAEKLERFMRYYYSPATRAVALMECNGLHVSDTQLEYLQGEESPVWNRIQRIENVELQETPEVVVFREKYKKIIKGEANVSYAEDLWGDDEAIESASMFNPNKKDQETALYLEHLQLKPLTFSKKTEKAQLNKDFLNHYAAPEVYLTLPAVQPYLEHYKKPIEHTDEGDPIFPKNPLQLILEYRELSKLGNTYLEGINDMIQDKAGDCIDGRIRASFHLAGTDTGRLCLRAGTKIAVVRDFSQLLPPYTQESFGVPIEDVNVGDLVYCYDAKCNLQLRKVLWQGQTGIKTIIRVTWRTKNRKRTGHLDLTPEHQVRMLDGSYRMAKELQSGDRLLSFHRNALMGGKYIGIYAKEAGSVVREHRFVFEQSNQRAENVHHIDGKGFNNLPDNLVGMSVTNHSKLHGDRRPTGSAHYSWRQIDRFSFLKELAKLKGTIGAADTKTHCSSNMVKKHSSFKRRCDLFGIDSRFVAIRYSKDGQYISRGRLKQLLLSYRAIRTVRSILQIGEKSLKKLISYYNLEAVADEVIRRNHMVVSVQKLSGSFPVYDLEVEGCHNFIANEICVHNSSSKPNLQNLPSGRSVHAKEIKNLFQAEPPSRRYPNGTVLIQLDYKTAEVRWAAIFANDKNLIRLFNEAREALLKACDPNSTITAEEFEQTQLASDIHRRTASLMFGVEPSKVNKSQRQSVKSITFGITYGMGTETLATNNGWTLEEAEEKVDMFFSAFPDLKKWLENNPKIAREKGYVETMMGRRRRLDIFYSKENFRLKAKADRLSMNAPIQGQSSDGGTIGLFQFLQYLLDNNLEKRWLVQNVVHDSCLVQVPMDDIDDALKAMQYHFVDGMSDYIKQHFGFTLPLPIECEIEVGIKYGDLTKWDGRPSTLPALKEKLKADAKALWHTKKEKTGKPAKDLDLVKWQGK